VQQGGSWWRRGSRGRQPAQEAVPLLAPGDGWAQAAAEFGRAEAEQISVLRLVLEPDLGSRPAQDPLWAARVRTLTHREHREAYAALRALFEALADAVPRVASADGPGEDGRPLLVCQANTAAAVNTVWAAVALLGADTTEVLGRILDRTLAEPWMLESGRLRNACARALAELDTPASVAALIEAAASAPTKTLKEQLLLCLDLAKHGAEQPPSRLAELHVPDHGLSGAGRLVLGTHHRAFELALLPDGQVSVEDRSPDGTPDQAAQRVLDAQVRAIRGTYRKELMRIEGLLATERSWSYEEWRRVYQDNPITRAVAARLVWRQELADGRVLELLPDTDGGVRHASPADGSRPASTVDEQLPVSVTLWHPRDADAAALASWRRIRDERALVQPFEQIDRDFTRVEPDPDALELNRHAAAVVDAAAFAAALPRLDWHSRRSRAGRSSDAVRLAYRDFPDARLSVAVPCLDRPDGVGGAEVVLGAGWFHRVEDRARTPLALGYVPPRVYSEALRDLAVLARGAQPAENEVNDRVGF
jgi:hypothetical protein